MSVTRLGVDRAQVSGDVPCAVGDRLQLEMDRPTDGQRIRILADVTAVHREGVQWGWKPSIHVALGQPLARALVVVEDETRAMVIEDDEPASGDEESVGALREIDDGSTPTEEDSFSFEVSDHEQGLSTITLPEFESPLYDGCAAGADESAELVPRVIEPEVHTLDDIVPDPPDLPDPSEHDPLRELPEAISISVEITPPWDTAEITTPPWDGVVEDPACESLSINLEEQPPRPSPRRPAAREPWNAPSGGHQAVESREARILSQVTVSYLAAGHKRFGTAQDFSRRGLFLAVPDEDPVPRVGAIVRIGFPIEFPGDMVVVRMTTEVRWSYGEDTPDSPGRGVGLQISAFDSASEQRFYEDYTRSLIDNTPGPAAPHES